MEGRRTEGGIRVRLGLDRNHPPHRILGTGLMGLGGLLVIASMPLYFWTTALGAFLVYLGYSTSRR